MGVIYLIENIITKKVYVGKTTSNDVFSYCTNHFKKAIENSDTKNKRYFYNAIRKYGKENFIIKILKNNIPCDSLNEEEKHFIIIHNSNNSKNGYNMTTGGDGGLTSSKKNISNKQKNIWANIEYCKKMSIERKNRWKNGVFVNNVLAGKKRYWSKESSLMAASEKFKGEKNGKAKITELEAITILKLFSVGWSLNSVAKKYSNISNDKNYFYELKSGKSFKHLKKLYPEIYIDILYYSNCKCDMSPDVIQEIVVSLKEKDMSDVCQQFSVSERNLKHLLKSSYYKKLITKGDIIC